MNGAKGLGMNHCDAAAAYKRKNDEQWIDLAIVDINMPVMNGEEMIDRMHKDPEMKGIPVIVVSTEGSKARIERLEHKGAVFIHKPFTAEIVRDTINSILGLGENNES